MRRLIVVLLTSLALGLAGCQAPRPIASTNPATKDPNYQPEPFTRILRPDTNTVLLQIAVRKFVPARHWGPTLWLAGTAHIGEPEYYRALQKQLDACTVVLYEGVDVDSHPRHLGKPGIAPRHLPGTHLRSEGGFSMQSALAKSLGLVFQLEAIDYDRTNFVNSDLSVLDIQRLMLGDQNLVPAPQGVKGKSDPSFDFLLQIMDGTSLVGNLFKLGIQYIGTNPEMAATTKLVLAETLGRLKGDFAQMRGLPPDMQHLVKVLVEARNEHVIEDLKTELPTLPRSGSIAVFYGTGHMENMEKRVIRDLGYHTDGEIWLTAFSVDIRKTGMSPAELQMMQNMVKWQLEQMQPQ